jgi:hypothetical protein
MECTLLWKLCFVAKLQQNLAVPYLVKIRSSEAALIHTCIDTAHLLLADATKMRATITLKVNTGILVTIQSNAH